MNVDTAIAHACELVPGLLHGVLAALPEGLLIAGVGDVSAFDREPLIRTAARCLSARLSPAVGAAPVTLVEYLLVGPTELVVIQGGRRFPRLALAVACTREPNLAFVLSSTRNAIRVIEATVDLAAWEL
jgi:hypothetical protein